MEKIRLSISKTSIETARQHQLANEAPSRTCVIAIALKRKFPNETNIGVGYRVANIGDNCYSLTEKSEESYFGF